MGGTPRPREGYPPRPLLYPWISVKFRKKLKQQTGWIMVSEK